MSREPEDDSDEPEEGFFSPEAVELPITDLLDLHSFRPSEVPDVVRDGMTVEHQVGSGTVTDAETAHPH